MLRIVPTCKPQLMRRLFGSCVGGSQVWICSSCLRIAGPHGRLNRLNGGQLLRRLHQGNVEMGQSCGSYFESQPTTMLSSTNTRWRNLFLPDWAYLYVYLTFVL